MDIFAGNQGDEEDVEMNETDNKNAIGGYAVLGNKQDIDLYIEAEREILRRQSLDRFIPSFQSVITVACLTVFEFVYYLCVGAVEVDACRRSPSQTSRLHLALSCRKLYLCSGSQY